MPKEFLLVHGACHGAWCWEEVTDRLRARGHRVAALDMPGHGRRAAEVRRASVASYAAAVAEALAAEGMSRAVVVGHSMGGLVIPKAAELAPARIRHLVFLAAVVVPQGGSLTRTLMTPAGREMMLGNAAARGDGTFLYPAEMAWARWMGDMPRSDPRVSRALSMLTPQALRPLVEPIDMRAFHALGVPRTYIRCLGDRAVLPTIAAQCAARLGVTPVDMDSAHNPMLSRPEELCRILERVDS
ncbi:MAG TPA: alpha/beta fold hydrolase [Methylomirabilota bacterium]|nr:alpha/beta fold hydrolase [Methylomirabilota bacterium]